MCELKIWGWDEIRSFWKIQVRLVLLVSTLKTGLLSRILLNFSSSGFFAMLATILSNIWYALVTAAGSSYK
jgi:hypothetical protein